jgi:hypothetical protein
MGQQRPDLAGKAWDPKYADDAAGDRTTYAATTDPDKPTNTPYTPAPAASSVFGFKLLDDSFSRNFVAESQGFPRGWSLVMVAFKRKGGGGIAAEYYYAFPTAAEAQTRYAAIAAAEHPRAVINDWHAAGVKYRKRAG